jgi:hypothetical protein
MAMLIILLIVSRYYRIFKVFLFKGEFEKLWSSGFSYANVLTSVFLKNSEI